MVIGRILTVQLMADTPKTYYRKTIRRTIENCYYVNQIMAGSYKNYMKLLQSWPLDKSKPGRDLGQHIRDQVKIAFSKGDASQVNQEQCDRYYASLRRIASNHYGQIYKRTFISSASGLTAEQCNIALSPEMQEFLKEEERSFIVKLIRSIQIRQK